MQNDKHRSKSKKKKNVAKPQPQKSKSVKQYPKVPKELNGWILPVHEYHTSSDIFLIKAKSKLEGYWNKLSQIQKTKKKIPRHVKRIGVAIDDIEATQQWRNNGAQKKAKAEETKKINSACASAMKSITDLQIKSWWWVRDFQARQNEGGHYQNYQAFIAVGQTAAAKYVRGIDYAGIKIKPELHIHFGTSAFNVRHSSSDVIRLFYQIGNRKAQECGISPTHQESPPVRMARRSRIASGNAKQWVRTHTAQQEIFNILAIYDDDDVYVPDESGGAVHVPYVETVSRDGAFIESGYVESELYVFSALLALVLFCLVLFGTFACGVLSGVVFASHHSQNKFENEEIENEVIENDENI